MSSDRQVIGSWSGRDGSMMITTAQALPPRPDLGWTDDEWRQFEAAWTHVAAKHDPPERGFSWSIFGWNEARKAWVTGLGAAIVAGTAPLVIEGGGELDWGALKRAALVGAASYILTWATNNKPKPKGGQIS